MKSEVDGHCQNKKGGHKKVCQFPDVDEHLDNVGPFVVSLCE